MAQPPDADDRQHEDRAKVRQHCEEAEEVHGRVVATSPFREIAPPMLRVACATIAAAMRRQASRRMTLHAVDHPGAVFMGITSSQQGRCAPISPPGFGNPTPPCESGIFGIPFQTQEPKVIRN